MKATAMSILSTMMLFLTIASSVACQRSETRQNSPTQPIYLGNLDKKIAEIYDDKNKSYQNVCDIQWRPKILEISRVLEKNRAAIEAMAEDQTNAKPQKTLEFGVFKFLDDTSTPVGKDEWSENIISWSRIAKIYEAIKKDPTNPAWVKLNLLARGIVSDDQKRIVNGVFYGVKRQSVPMVLEIDRKATACLQVETCTNPELTDAEASFLSSHTLLNYEIRGFKNPKATDEQKRQNFERFATRVHFLADKYGMHKINILKVTDKVLTVPMDLSVLGDDGAALFMEYIEKTWNIDSEYSIKIEAVKDGSPAFKLKVDNVIGGRANVSRNELYMQLYNFGGIKTATHEFGHELGFSDNYYTSWDTDTCAYTTEGNRGEIMSNSAQGAVLPRHWETLKKTYWDDQTQQAPK